MSEPVRTAVAEGVLAVHLLIIGFNLFGLIVVPLGGWLSWRFVRLFWWRALHLASLMIVALQALAGRACILTLLQDALSGRREAPLIMGWINRIIFWPLPLWVFSTFYVLILGFALALWWLVPPKRTPRSAS